MYIFYEDQVPKEKDLLDKNNFPVESNHNGWLTKNVNVWLPLLKKAVKEHKSEKSSTK